MSKTVSKLALAAGLVLAMALIFVGCSEQAKTTNNEQPNKEQPDKEQPDNGQKLLGTWAEVKRDGGDGNIWVFNSDGTATIRGKTTRYAVVVDKLAIVDIISLIMGDNSLFYGKTASCELFISTDGKTAILINPFFHFLLQKKD
jgi:hypothetical protein